MFPTTTWPGYVEDIEQSFVDNSWSYIAVTVLIGEVCI